MKVTLAVIFYNEEKVIGELLKSLESEFSAEHSKDFEFMFIDNNSTDNSPSIVKAWVEKWTNTYQVRLIARQKNSLALARTEAIKKAQGEWVAYVDADSQLKAGWPRWVLKSLQDLPEQAVIVGGLSQYVGNQPWHQYAKSLSEHFPLGKKNGQRVEVQHVPTNNCLLKVEAGLRISGFDPFFTVVGEDLDFNARIRTIGKVFYDPLFGVTHTLPGRVEDWYRKMALYGRAQSYIFLRHKGAIPLEKFIPLLVCILAGAILALYPMIGFMGFVFLLVVPRTRFFLLSFLFYGLGEFFGFFKYGYLKMFHESSVVVIDTAS